MKRLGSVIGMFAGILVLTPAVSADRSATQQPTFRSQASLVALNVTVQDRAAKYVTGLKPDDFAVYEDGVRQNVQFFQSDTVPADLIVLLDTSASMTDKIDLVREAADGFLHTLRPDDRGAVVSFSDTVTILQPLTADHQALERAVASVRPHGATAMNNAVYIALKAFGQSARQTGAVRRQAIAVLSDGDDTASLVSFDDVLALARQMDVNIYTVGLQAKSAMQRELAETGRHFLSEDDYSMEMLSRETGALSYFPTVDRLKSVYASIAQELAHQYSIGYVPADQRVDGRFHQVVVQVVSRPELKARTRLGYTAQAAARTSDHP